MTNGEHAASAGLDQQSRDIVLELQKVALEKLVQRVREPAQEELAIVSRTSCYDDSCNTKPVTQDI